MKTYKILLLSLSFIILSCSGQTKKDIQTVEAATFSEKIKETQNPQILDVRTPEEFEMGHLKGALNIDWLGDSFIEGTKKLDKTKPVFVYCKSGRRSLQASEKLKELGFSTIYNLDGGFTQWSSEGFESNKQ